MSNSQFIKDISQYTNEGMLLFDNNRVIHHVNTSFLTMAGLSQENIIGKKLEDLFPQQQEEDFFQHLAKVLERNKSWQGDISIFSGSEESRSNRVVIMNLEYESGAHNFYLALFARHDKTLEDNYDKLTGLAGSSIFFDRVEQSLIASRRDNSRIAVLLINLDRLSLINDGLGHHIGDGVLKETADRLAASFRESDTVARISGDSFALLIKISADNHAALVAEKVLHCIRTPMNILEHAVVISASMGIVTSMSSKERATDIFSQAESALNRAKDMGGNQYQFFSRGLNEAAKKRIEMENNLRSAVNSGEFLLYYQPKVDTRSTEIIGMEALIRWNHPALGMVPPFHFIPVAEETGMIIDIGHWVLNEACRQNSEWQKMGLPAVPIAVNVSARQFQFGGFVDDVKSAISTSGLDPKYLELEITENMLMSDIEQTIEKLQELSGVGLSMAIDDFGTGYSNLSYLVRFPVSTLKIDRAFVKDIESNTTIAALTRSIIKMSHNLNLKVVAEGAENQGHISFLKEHGCNVVQGYFYSKPVPAEEFAVLLKEGVRGQQ